jgi:hypothetical protein
MVFQVTLCGPGIALVQSFFDHPCSAGMLSGSMGPAARFGCPKTPSRGISHGSWIEKEKSRSRSHPWRLACRS